MGLIGGFCGGVRTTVIDNGHGEYSVRCTNSSGADVKYSQSTENNQYKMLTGENKFTSDNVFNSDIVWWIITAPLAKKITAPYARNLTIKNGVCKFWGSRNITVTLTF